jgi:hypothetical protein
VSEVLGREYSRIQVLSHRAFEVSGTTARLYTSDFSYSEAWAGSGEFAAIQVVTAVLNAEPKSLVLLDEPEVSLHPGAQRRLLHFLATTARERRLQVVFATHSPMLLEDLPPEAIKVLDVDPATNRVVLRSQSSSPEAAFIALEHRFKKKTVVVEDSLAKEVVLKALRGGGDALVGVIDVKELPGGAHTLRSRSLPAWALEGRDDTLLMLDGDMRLDPPARTPASIPPEELAVEAARLLGVSDVKGYIAANTGGATDVQLCTVLDWGVSHLRFLPGDNPEAWLRSISSGHEESDSKEWWVERTHSSLGKASSESVDGREILEYQKRVLADIADDHEDFIELRKSISDGLRVD